MMQHYVIFGDYMTSDIIVNRGEDENQIDYHSCARRIRFADCLHITQSSDSDFSSACLSHTTANERDLDPHRDSTFIPADINFVYCHTDPNLKYSFSRHFKYMC